MQIANRESFAVASRRGWKNPYVTDGLVAMWDGEWNAGGGVHDASATRWIDVVSSIAATSSSPFTVGENYMQRTGSKIMSASLPVTILATDDLAFEVVMQSGGVGNNGCVTIGGGLLVTVKSDGVVYFAFSNSATQNGFFNTGKVNVRSAYTLNRNGGASITAYRNGVYATRSTSGMGTATNASTIQLGQGRSAAYFMNYYCFRIYRRMLAATEIAANHAIDRERFNLP